MTRKSNAPSPEDHSEVDPEEFVRALLHISPEDAAEVREHADEKADPRSG